MKYKPEWHFFLRLLLIKILLIIAIQPSFAQLINQYSNHKLTNTLIEAIQQKGEVQVIVGLKLPEEASSHSVFIQPTDSVSTASQRNIISQLQSRVLSNLNLSNSTLKRFIYIPYIALTINGSILEQLQKNPEVVSIQEDHLLELLATDAISMIGADQVWSQGITGSGQVVAIVDTGVDSNHISLAGKVVAEACYSTTHSTDNTTSLCPAGSNPDGQDEQVGTGAARPCGEKECEHGTHVAGIAAANGASFSGVAKDAQIIAVQVFSKTTGGTITAYTSDLIRALEYIYTLRDRLAIAAVNMSIGSSKIYTSTAECDADYISLKAIIDNLRAEGIATVVASGNLSASNGTSAPACISSTISVGATTASDTVANFSNSASWLSLLAPGVDIYSTIPGNNFAIRSGTSMAAPHVTGAWALLKSSSSLRNATVDEIFNLLSSSGKPILDARNGITKPRIQVNAALEPMPLSIKTTDLPMGLVDVQYNASLVAEGGSPPYKWYLITNTSLPLGLVLDSDTGVISGKPTQSGTIAFKIQVSDNIGNIANQDFSIHIVCMNVPGMPSSCISGRYPQLPTLLNIKRSIPSVSLPKLLYSKSQLIEPHR